MIIMGDCFTKWVEAVMTLDQEVKTVADVFVQTVPYQAPQPIHTDQRRNFE